MKIIEWCKNKLRIGRFFSSDQRFSDGGQALLNEPSRAAGRPAIFVDRAKAEAMLRAGIAQAEVARRLGIKAPTLFNRIKEWAANPLPAVEPVTIPDPPRAVVAPETIKAPIRPAEPNGSIAKAPEPPAGLLDGLVRPGVAVKTPQVIPEVRTVAAEPDEEYLFLTADEKDADAAAGKYGLHAAAWTDSNVQGRIRGAKRLYVVVPDDSARAGILEALAKSPVASRIRLCFGGTTELFTIARRVFVDGNAQQVEVFERFAGLGTAPEPILIRRPEPVVKHGGLAPDSYFPNSALQ